MIAEFLINLDCVTVRSAVEADIDSLYNIYCSSKTLELSLLIAFPQSQKEIFLKQQFEAQHKYYSTKYKHVFYGVLESNGGIIGRLYIGEKDNELVIIDITLLPMFRNKGFGRKILSEVIKYAKNSGKNKVVLQVENSNNAIFLYKKLCFMAIKNDGIFTLMELKEL